MGGQVGGSLRRLGAAVGEQHGAGNGVIGTASVSSGGPRRESVGEGRATRLEDLPRIAQHAGDSDGGRVAVGPGDALGYVSQGLHLRLDRRSQRAGSPEQVHGGALGRDAGDLVGHRRVQARRARQEQRRVLRRGEGRPGEGVGVVGVRGQHDRGRLAGVVGARELALADGDRGLVAIPSLHPDDVAGGGRR